MRPFIVGLAFVLLTLNPAVAQQGCPGGAPSVARIVSAMGPVEVGRAGYWYQVVVPPPVSLCVIDLIRTGPQGRARIEFLDRREDINAGPSVVNVGAATTVGIESFRVGRQNEPRTGVLNLIKGTIRAFTKNWGYGAAFQVRTGTSVCGIRGSHTFSHHDPDAQRETHAVEHGLMVCDLRDRGVVDLPDGRMVQVVAGRSQLRELTLAEWQAMVNFTADPPGAPPLDAAGGAPSPVAGTIAGTWRFPDGKVLRIEGSGGVWEVAGPLRAFQFVDGDLALRNLREIQVPGTPPGQRVYEADVRIRSSSGAEMGWQVYRYTLLDPNTVRDGSIQWTRIR